MTEIQQNPYAPGVISQNSGAQSDAEVIRSMHLAHEYSIKSTALVFVVVGAIMAIVGANFVHESIFQVIGLRNSARTLYGAPATWAVWYFVFGLFLVFVGVAQCVVAYGIRNLKPWSKNPSIVLATLGLLVFPIGTFINIVILFQLFASKTKMVFSEHYQEVIQQTPHMKHQTSAATWAVLVAFLVFVFWGITMTVLSS
ncbi:hypothetical protein [Mariniblastus fucicola]|uniref:Uncharacterized protein n=1 Tax=Mariniblastus fucicola TaxID=980251 RepID=A0A5B9P8J9_9BACT|nr:hypothetical protein [Mariniblastus fucicola]QEG21535.1 hypothetical protein MFFC18_13910 [Mariniblastus fucicola]